MFNRADPPCSTGDGRAMAYRIGAELSTMEFPKRWAGPKYLARCGKATWIGVYRDPQDKPIGPFVTKPERKYGDAIGDAYPTVYEDFSRSGKGPVYMDCRGISDSDYDYMMYGLTNEGNTAMLNYMKEDKIDIRKNPIEFMTYEMTTRGGINYNEKGETSVNGLYAAGDEFFGGISNASTFGWIAGENSARFAQKGAVPEAGLIAKIVKGKKELPAEIRGRKDGVTWQEANIAVQQVMFDYAGTVRTENLLHAGMHHLAKLKEKIYNSLAAKNQHELMHCIEVLNLVDIAEIVVAAVAERKETRGKYSRLDYPFTNPMLNNKTLICRKSESGPVFEWRDVKSST
jgi:succinate dehydrogenase/fumarate reductase flavoprotein subunit